MKVGEIVELRPSRGAANRTKNRIREHGPSFEIRNMKENVTCLGVAGVFLVALTKNASDFKGGKESWTGWLPTKEIEVVNESR
jgi:hypothetical protein